MGIFATLARRGAQAEVAPGVGPVEDVRHLLPARFEAVGEHLAAGRDASNACAMVGREMARDGADLGEALDGLQDHLRMCVGRGARFPGCARVGCRLERGDSGLPPSALLRGPADGTGQPCASAGQALRGLSQCRAGGTSTTTSHALVIVDLPLLARRFGLGGRRSRPRCGSRVWPRAHGRRFPAGRPSARPARRGWSWSRSAATCWPDAWGCCAHSRRTPTPASSRARVWIEGLPPTDDGAAMLLDELARG